MENLMSKKSNEDQEKLNLGNLKKSDLLDDAKNEEEAIEEVTQKVLTNERITKDLFAINAPNFENNVTNHIKAILEEIRKMTDEQRKKILLNKKLKIIDAQLKVMLVRGKEIFNKLILRTKRKEITIPKHASPLRHAAAIILAVSLSNEDIPKLSGSGLATMIGASSNKVNNLYNLWYKGFAPKSDFNFQSAKLGRKPIFLYFFEQLIDTEINLIEFISHLERINTLKLVSRLKKIIINAKKQKTLDSLTNTSLSMNFTAKEQNLLKQLTERQIKDLQYLVNNYSDTFDKYFFDLVEMIKLLMISNKSHKIISADFSIAHFVRFLMEKGIDFLSWKRLEKLIGAIFSFLKNTKYSYLFPAQMHSEKIITYEEGRPDLVQRKIVGRRIKLYAMRYIYNGRYFEKGIAKCTECVREGFTINTSIPRAAAKEFHHKIMRMEGYTVNELYALFTEDRGNPYFLPDLIERMEREGVIVRCKAHHQIIHSHRFNNFKKLISWENIPREFPQDIFDLPADIIHILVWISVNSFPLPLLLRQEDLEKLEEEGEEASEEINIIATEEKISETKYATTYGVIYFLQKKYIIDRIYGGICSACGEFNTREHLPSFDFNHLYEVLYELGEISLKDRELYKKMKKKVIRMLYTSTRPCSEIVKELEREQGGYICCNCHVVIHTDLSLINKIYDDQNIIRKIVMDKENVIKKYRNNLIDSTESNKDPLRAEIARSYSYWAYLEALYIITNGKQGGVSRSEIKDYFKQKGYGNIFEKREFSKKYVRIVAGTEQRPTMYYITDEGRIIVRLIYYFKNYYLNFRRTENKI